MKLRLALLSATVLALPLAAVAQPITGLYVGGGAGFNIQQSEFERPSTALATPGYKSNFDVGGTGVLSFGYGLGNGLRVEVEGNYRYDHVNRFQGGPTPVTEATGGYQETYGAMGNVLYDFDLGFPVYPYVGVGAGYEWTKWKNMAAIAINGSSYTSSDSQTGGFGYQGIVGVSYPVAPVPGLSLTAEYRFMGVLTPEAFSGQNLTPLADGGYHQARGNWDIINNYNHSAMIGVRYAFGVTPPPPPPPPAPAPAAVPAPAPARTYLVFFDWDKSDLTERARQIIHEAADASTHVQTTTIEVNGYTDLSGTAKYNMGLSIRRADAVKAELIRDGVASNEIEAQGFGEEHPLVPTAKGVREPQNRRVEIILK
jgi:outer membrane protein OmpA-like peptidoglycan-associated protein